MGERFIDSWKRIEGGDSTPYYGISFEDRDMTTMLSTSAPKRCAAPNP